MKIELLSRWKLEAEFRDSITRIREPLKLNGTCLSDGIVMFDVVFLSLSFMSHVTFNFDVTTHPVRRGHDI